MKSSCFEACMLGHSVTTLVCLSQLVKRLQKRKSQTNIVGTRQTNCAVRCLSILWIHSILYFQPFHCFVMETLWNLSFENMNTYIIHSNSLVSHLICFTFLRIADKLSVIPASIFFSECGIGMFQRVVVFFNLHIR